MDRNLAAIAVDKIENHLDQDLLMMLLFLVMIILMKMFLDLKIHGLLNSMLLGVVIAKN